jgi:membrane-associated phospholipid phosphatase
MTLSHDATRSPRSLAAPAPAREPLGPHAIDSEEDLRDLPSPHVEESAGLASGYVTCSWKVFTATLKAASPDAQRLLVGRLFGGLPAVLLLMAGMSWTLGRGTGNGPLPGDLATSRALEGMMSVTIADSLTPLGGTIILLPLVLIVAMVASRRARPERALTLVVTFLAAKAITKVGWDFWARERPGGVGSEAYIPAAPSFPSGHALQATAVWVLLAAWAIGASRSTGERIAVALGAVLLIGVEALTRIRLGAHYASDVWAALLSGVVWAGIALWAEGGFTTRHVAGGGIRT